MKCWIGISIIAWVLPAFAVNLTTPSDLPSTTSAIQWIESDPAVVEARSALLAAGHASAMLDASPNEWTTRLSFQRRNFDTGGPVSKEWNAQLERPIRINGKADLDRQLGGMELLIAEAKVSDAVSASARSLLDLWIDGLAAAQAQKLFQEQQSFAQANLRAVQTRQKAGDASALDVSVTAADLADVQRQASLADSNLAKARAKLRVRFPGATLPVQLLTDPQPLDDAQAQWTQRVLDAAASLRTAEGELRKAELTASRASADRVPDPTVGFFAASESFGKERVVGLSLSIPLSGTYRNERMQQALQEAEIARSAVERQRRDLEAGVAETYADATGNLARWKLAEQGAKATGESARLTQRAYSLGETDLQALLLARRQFLEAARTALEARAEALRSNYRLLVDARMVWDLAAKAP